MTFLLCLWLIFVAVLDLPAWPDLVLLPVPCLKGLRLDILELGLVPGLDLGFHSGKLLRLAS